MDKVCVDGAIFISAFSLYRYDASYAVEVQRAHPGRNEDGIEPAADLIGTLIRFEGMVGLEPQAILNGDEVEQTPLRLAY